jgi:hypothetical protein
MRTRNIVLLLSGLLSAAVLGWAPKAVAQFTSEELSIIQREWREEHGELYAIPLGFPVAESGGSGRDRWALYQLDADEWGNQYMLHSDDVSSLSGSQSARSIQYTVQVYYQNPSQHDGVLLREVTFLGECRAVNAQVAVRVVQDFDATGSLMRTDQRNESLRNAEGRERRDLSVACYAAHTYPYLIELLEQGQGQRSDY